MVLCSHFYGNYFSGQLSEGSTCDAPDHPTKLGRQPTPPRNRANQSLSHALSGIRSRNSMPLETLSPCQVDHTKLGMVCGV